MALDRTNFNAWHDDSGSNTDGTVADKATMEDAILDPVDAEIVRLDAATATGVAGYAGLTSDGTKVTQIAFPATQVPSGNANTLDDYEEGTFTPTLFGSTTPGSPTYVAQIGKYTKIGNLVTYHIYVEISNGGATTAGNWKIGGLPFTPTSDWNGGSGIAGWRGFGGGGAGYPMLLTKPADPSLQLYLNSSIGGTPSPIAVTTGAFVAYIQCSGSYQV